MTKTNPSLVTPVDKFKYLKTLADAFERVPRQGREIDIPEGARFITISDTLARQISKDLRDLHDKLNKTVMVA